jgi:mannose-6-phosphate isomerase-like protein (cupin superfamily)
VVNNAYTHRNLTEVHDSAADMGLGESQESRFATGDLGTRHTGVTHHRFRAGKRQPIGHRHEHEGAEEVYVVLAGSGRLKLDDEILQIERLDAIRVAPSVTRAFEAGPDGLEVLAFGPHHEGDGEVLPGWWDQ